MFTTAVLSPVVDAMSRRLPWSRRLCCTVLVLGIVVITGVALAILLQPIVDAVRNFNDSLPRLEDEARHIPNIGSLIAGIIIGIVALSVSLGALIAFVIVILVYQQVENYILQPTIIGKAADVSGFTVIVSVLVFCSLFGIIGAIIGVPIAAAIEIVLDEATARRRARIAGDDAASQQPA